MAIPTFIKRSDGTVAVIVPFDAKTNSFTMTFPPKPPKDTLASVWFERAWRRFWTGHPEPLRAV